MVEAGHSHGGHSGAVFKPSQLPERVITHSHLLANSSPAVYRIPLVKRPSRKTGIGTAIGTRPYSTARVSSSARIFPWIGPECASCPVYTKLAMSICLVSHRRHRYPSPNILGGGSSFRFVRYGTYSSSTVQSRAIADLKQVTRRTGPGHSGAYHMVPDATSVAHDTRYCCSTARENSFNISDS